MAGRAVTATGPSNSPVIIRGQQWDRSNPRLIWESHTTTQEQRTRATLCSPGLKALEFKWGSRAVSRQNKG